MNIRSGWPVPAAWVMVAAVLFQAGCEVTSEGKRVGINPNSATVVKGQSVTLTAENVDDFVWQLETPAYGTLNSVRGDTVVYTSQYAPPAGGTVVQKVRLIRDLSSSTTNTPGILAEAFITHVSGAIRVSPASATLRQGESVNLTASGGGTYTWTLATPSYGVLSSTAGNQARYTSQYAAADGKSVTQVITVTSDNGGSTTAVITQLPDGILTLAPSTTTLRNGMSQIFTISGGSDYSFTVAPAGWGIITILSEDTFRYTSTRTTAPGVTEAATITVRDISSATAVATVYNVP